MPRLFILLFTIIASLLLMLLPLPYYLSLLNPTWILLTLLFWNHICPRWVNIGLSWCMGIVLDGLTASILGLHAMGFVIIIYLFDVFYRRFKMFHIVQQTVMIGILFIVYWMIILLTNHVLTQSPICWPLFLNAFTSAFCWPLYRLFAYKFHSIKG